MIRRNGTISRTVCTRITSCLTEGVTFTLYTDFSHFVQARETVTGSRPGSGGGTIRALLTLSRVSGTVREGGTRFARARVPVQARRAGTPVYWLGDTATVRRAWHTTVRGGVEVAVTLTCQVGVVKIFTSVLDIEVGAGSCILTLQLVNTRAVVQSEREAALHTKGIYHMMETKPLADVPGRLIVRVPEHVALQPTDIFTGAPVYTNK